ncbi:DUF1116 domain-containing protein [Bailinhaonella thermotolerans]|uniref:DUF1116 domain-containing protein n=1 Tax=Bailinhaonella thermotolerans TaxID=1070861 RepID=A0A3A4AXU1_9ACTN|nr:DUF1116 domain-containing protein [Bailinhaonella thermotolerans]RJL35492.1 DUF1116 domain-containing protein [Bailinhaonella thermotolerans]
MWSEHLDVVNVGLAGFGDNIRDAGGSVTTLDWRPPALGDPGTALALARIAGHPEIERANQVAFERYLSAQPVLTDVMPAGEAIPAMAGERLILHSGPPIAWDRMAGPVKGAIAGAIVFEGWAPTPEKAAELAASGEISFSPAHHHGAVGPMAGVISPSMPVWVVRDATSGRLAYSNFNEGLGKVLRFGANGPEVLERLRWMSTELAQALRPAVQRLDGLELKPLIGQALHMGDEVHNRNAAATGLLLKRLLPALIATGPDNAVLSRAAEFITGNDHFFLNVSMAACKAMLDAAAGVPHSSMVTAMARNGVNFGIRVSGTGDRWFQAPANPVDGLFFPGYGVADAAPDLGDSAITETAGLGGFAMAASPAIVKFVGGTPADATAHSRRMREITLGVNPVFTLPALDFGASAAGIDVRSVVDTGIQPVINTGIAHKEAGVGQIGAGVTTAPLPCFTQAVDALADGLGLAAGAAA